MQPAETEARAFDTVGISVSTSFNAGVPLKVVSERLGHSTPAFTMAVYQHVLPGMQRAAADLFAQLITGEEASDEGAVVAVAGR